MQNLFEALLTSMLELLEVIHENKRLILYSIWQVSCVLLILLWFTERLYYKISKKQIIEREILTKIILSIMKCNNIETVQLLQKYPSYVNISAGELKYTPFLVACYYGNTLAVQFMLRIGAKLTMKTKQEESPFYLAVAHLVNNPFSIDASCIRELFYAGCDINLPNIHGYTPLHVAAFFGHKTLVKWLLEKGANTRVKPSPAEVASTRGHLDLANIILNWESKRKMIEAN